ncbi:MAG: hypothetical protein JKY09_08830 [Crocinitomicaceae bacterium]|nr:hypothetical protein [Crocinitomicaceae bacterium]
MATLPIVNTLDKRKAIIVSITLMVLLLILLFVLKFEKADPPPRDIPVELAEPLDVTEIENIVLEGGAGGGTPSEDPVNDIKQQTETVLTQETNPESQSNTGNANATNTPDSNNDPSGDESNNPFNDGGNDGGGGDGTGGHFGTDDGSGTGGSTGSGGGKGRIRLNNVNIDGLQSNIDATIALKLTIDAQGNVVVAHNIKGQTTTADQKLINRVINEVKKQVKYSKEPGAPLVKKYYTVKIKAQ